MAFLANLSIRSAIAGILCLAFIESAGISLAGLWLWQQFHPDAEISTAFLIFAATLAVSLLIVYVLLIAFFQPLGSLSEVLKRAASDAEYSLRAPCLGEGEVSALCGSVNLLLARVEALRRGFDRVNKGIDTRVVARTAKLSMQRDLAEAANCAKSEFLASMSHEIRTPMTAILGYAGLLSEANGDTEELKEHAGIISRNGKHLLTILDEILDLSKIEAGRMSVERIACNPAQIVSDVAALVRPLAAQKSLEFALECKTPIPVSICTDPTRLRQILLNLIGNAVKFTQRGQVSLSVLMVDAAHGVPAQLAFEVVDTGIGMTPAEVERLFTPFTQAGIETTRKFGGTGLGLSISKRLAELLGGTIIVDSVPGQGSRFVLTVATGPLDGVERTKSLSHSAEISGTNGSPSKADRLDGARLLLVEDSEDNRRLITRVLEKLGAEVFVAENGRAGCDLALQSQVEGTPFDVILMDMQMPVLDGFSAVRELRSSNYVGPIVALTAGAMSRDYWKCLDAGCDDYAAKPIDPPQLVAMIRSYVYQAVSTSLH